MARYIVYVAIPSEDGYHVVSSIYYKDIPSGPFSSNPVQGHIRRVLRDTKEGLEMKGVKEVFRRNLHSFDLDVYLENDCTINLRVSD